MIGDPTEELPKVSTEMIRASNDFARRSAIDIQAQGMRVTIDPQFSDAPFHPRLGFTGHINGMSLGIEAEALPFRPALEKQLGEIPFDSLDGRLQLALIEDFAAALLDDLHRRHGGDLRFDGLRLSSLEIPPQWNIATFLRARAKGEEYRLRLFCAADDSRRIAAFFPPARPAARGIRIEAAILLAPIPVSVGDMPRLRRGDVLLLPPSESHRVLVRLADRWWPAFLEGGEGGIRLRRQEEDRTQTHGQGSLREPNRPLTDHAPPDTATSGAEDGEDSDVPTLAENCLLPLDPLLSRLAVTVDDLAGFLGGDPLILEADPGQSVILFLDQRPVFRGSLVTIRGQRGILLAKGGFDPTMVPGIAARPQPGESQDKSA